MLGSVRGPARSASKTAEIVAVFVVATHAMEGAESVQRRDSRWRK
jgi:hypothetical protein